MKKKWAIVLIIIVLLIAGGVYVYFNFGASASVLINSSQSHLVCRSKPVQDRVLFYLGDSDQLYMGKKSMELKSGENDDGIYLRQGNLIYYTNGLVYDSTPKLSDGESIINVGPKYYLGSKIADISDLKVASAERLYAYKGYLYLVDSKTDIKVSSGFLYQIDGVIKSCGSTNAYEIDAGRMGYEILADSNNDRYNKISFRLKVLDKATGKEIVPISDKTKYPTYDVEVGQEVQLVDVWSPSDQIGKRTRLVNAGERLATWLSDDRLKMNQVGETTITIKYTLQGGVEYSDTVTLTASNG